MLVSVPGGSYRPPLLTAAGIALGASVVAGYAYAVAASRPFTVRADLLTALPLAVLGVALVRTVVRRGQGRPPRSAERVLAPWLIAGAALCSWELAVYVAGFSARHDYPTISSLLDSAFRWRASKAGIFVLWLGLGWGLVRR